MNINEFLFSASRLWRYLNIYFLKPFDAINDTLTSTILNQLDWEDEFIEIGSGDGMYSFIMHGGSFPLSFDRYLLADTTLSDDIYDYHKKNVLSTKKIPSKPILSISLDAKKSHILKVREIGYARNSSVVSYESLPFLNKNFHSIFLYTPHGLEDHKDAIKEASRVLMDGGSLYILVYDENFQKDFICYRIGQKFKGFIGKYFKNLDSGRHDEITSMARSQIEWKALFQNLDLKIEKEESGLSGFAWRMYDIQTRPILKPLISFFGLLPKFFRTTIKVIIMLSLYPFLLLFYLIFSNRLFKLGSYNCYIAYQLRK